MSAKARDFVRRLAAAPLAALLLAAGSAHAQTAQGPQPPENYTVDANNVDVVMGTFNHSATDVAIGPENGGLAYSRTTAGESQRGSFDGLIGVQAVGEVSPGNYIWSYTVGLGGGSTDYQVFSTSSPTATMTSRGADGSSLTFDGVNLYTHVDASGTVRQFSTAYAGPVSPPTWTPPAGPGGRITRLTKSDGERWDWHYRSETVGAVTTHRIQSVTSTRGYQIKFEYDFNGDPTTQAELTAFGLLASARGINNAVDYCAPAADTCSGFTEAWPVATYARTTVTGGQRLDVTNSLSQTTGYIYQASSGGPVLTQIEFAEPGRAPIAVTYDSLARVATWSDGGAPWTYLFEASGHSFQNTTVTDPNGNQTRYRARMNIGPPPGPMGDRMEINRLNYILDPVGNRTDTEYDNNGRLTALQFPEGNRTEYVYDSRGNITEMRRKAKPSAPAADIVVEASYPASCVAPVTAATCNKPISITDARLAVTNFTYFSHGGMETETGPAQSNGVRPQTRYSYQERAAWYRTNSGGAFTAGASIWLPVTTSACATAAAPTPGCTGTADEVKTTVGYQTGSASIASNLLPLTSTSGAGDGSLAATTTTSWDARGDVKTVDGPLTGTQDLVWHVYDAVRRPVGQINPDPDVSGALLFPAVRTVYGADGLVVSVQQGTTTAQSDTAFAAFSQLARVDTAYDAEGRKIRNTQVLGTGTIGLTQYSYDPGDRPTCTAVRMNPAVYGSLPASACDASTVGAFGDDRISQNGYDAASRLTTITSAVDSAVEQITRVNAYTQNGQIDWIEDANGNRSDYTYDGFDRISRLNFPSATVGAHAANANDYEQYGYDANGNVVSRQLRNPTVPGSAPVITFTFDALNRETVKTIPGGGTADDVFSVYDNLGRRLAARFDNATTGDGVIWTWDALGRPLTETAWGRTLTSQYDLAGRRTKLYWPGTDYIEYVWDRADRVLQLRENGVFTGAQLLNHFVYDDLGRRTFMARGNGASSDWNYLANSRDWSLIQNLTGTAEDLTQVFTVTPAGQVSQRTASNSIYSYVPSALMQTYTRDGLNRYTAVAGSSFTYDGRGNLTADGARTYGYDLENRLTAVGGASTMTLSYDPLGRLRQTTAGATTTQFLYDGGRLVAEYDGAGALNARYAHGSEPDEPLVWYGGATLTDRRWLHVDAQGSVIGTSGATGSLVGLPYSYSPYGEPDGNYGFSGGSRFRYTGQMSLRDAPLWHYKARAYSPTLGRFMQSDPVGYQDQMNLYAYVGNDPVNASDPTGLYKCGDGPCSPEIKQAVEDIERARDASTNEAEREQLSELLITLGEADHENGVNIVYGEVMSGADATGGVDSAGNILITVAPHMQSFSQTEGGAAELASIIGHETRHGIDAKTDGNPGTESGVRDTDRRAWRDGIAILRNLQALGDTVIPSFRLYPLGSPEAQDMINDRAEISVTKWCEASGRC